MFHNADYSLLCDPLPVHGLPTHTPRHVPITLRFFLYSVCYLLLTIPAHSAQGEVSPSSPAINASGDVNSLTDKQDIPENQLTSTPKTDVSPDKEPSLTDKSPTSAEQHKDSKKKDARNAAAWPPVDALITSPFGAPRSVTSLFGPEMARFHRHSGLDIRAHLNWPVCSLRAGSVVSAGARGNAGIAVEVLQDNGKRAVYAHLSKTLVKQGESVSKGQHIGLVGCTGRTTGAHLHLSMYSSSGQLINPRPEITSLGELFNPPTTDLTGHIDAQSCNGARYPAGYAQVGPVNPRLRGAQQYLRMRKALTGIKDYQIPDIVTWESTHR